MGTGITTDMVPHRAELGPDPAAFSSMYVLACSSARELRMHSRKRMVSEARGVRVPGYPSTWKRNRIECFF